MPSLGGYASASRTGVGPVSPDGEYLHTSNGEAGGESGKSPRVVSVFTYSRPPLSHNALSRKWDGTGRRLLRQRQGTRGFTEMVGTRKSAGPTGPLALHH
jgi:hypothetical protein